MVSDILTMTVAQALAWLATFGIAAGVAYLLARVEWDEKIEKAIQVFAVAVLTAFLTAATSLVPPAWMDKKLVDAAVALIAFLFNFGGAQFGKYGATMHNLNLRGKEASVFACEASLFEEEPEK